jgi:hypothetical protein
LNKESIQTKMHIFRLTLITSLVLVFFSGVIAASKFESYFIHAEKEFEIELDTRNENIEEVSFSFAEYDIDAPAVCREANVFCHERTVITSQIKKEWEVVPVVQIWNPDLSPQDFANFYPDLPEDKIISNGSHPNDKWTAQKILYERGLLDVFPTGKIGFKTEEAITKLQHYKDIEEIDEDKGIVVIGPETIRELNKLKDRMKSPEFTPNAPMPPLSLSDFPEFQKKRLQQINSELEKRSLPVSSSSPVLPSIDIVKPENNGDLLKFRGKAEILSGE